MTSVQFPNESDSYRQARDELLKAELDLRTQAECVAEQRRNLPLGGELKQDYAFEEQVKGSTAQTKFSDLFAPGKDTLFLYSFMYGPDMKQACPMCTSMMDGLDGQVEHLSQRINVAAVAKNPIAEIRKHAAARGWSRLRLLSSANTTYNTDYLGETDKGQMPMINVFVKDGDTIRHSWGSEMLYAKAEEGQNMRHADTIWPLWSVLDMTPEGRGANWYPKLSY